MFLLKKGNTVQYDINICNALENDDGLVYHTERPRNFDFRNFAPQWWWRVTVVERRSLAGELSLSCARPAADG